MQWRAIRLVPRGLRASFSPLLFRDGGQRLGRLLAVPARGSGITAIRAYAKYPTFQRSAAALSADPVYLLGEKQRTAEIMNEMAKKFYRRRLRNFSGLIAEQSAHIARIPSRAFAQKIFGEKNRAPQGGPVAKRAGVGAGNIFQRGTCCAPATLGGYQPDAAARSHYAFRAPLRQRERGHVSHAESHLPAWDAGQMCLAL